MGCRRCACLICLVLLVMPLMAVEPGSVLIHLKGDLALRPEMGLLGQGTATSLHQACELVRRAYRADEGTVALDLTAGFAPGLAAAEELASVLRTKPAGKRLICLIDDIDDGGWLVANACDEICAVEAGFLAIDGLALEVDYFAGALDKIGVKFHAVTSGPEKTAPEALTATGPSEAAKREYTKLLKEIDVVLVAGSARQGLDEAGLRKVRAQSPQAGSQAAALGIADRAMEPGAWLADLPQPMREEDGDRELPDPSTFTGMMALWAELLNGPSEPKLPEVVAVLELEGEIVDGHGGTPGRSVAAEDVVKTIEELVEDARIKAVVVRVNSPGGSASASDRICHALKRLDQAKPVVTLFDDVAASGGYYLACGTREVLVHKGTITGSIGVFALMPDLAGTWEKLGITTFSLKTDPRADLFTAGAFTEEKRQALTTTVEAIDRRFQQIVATARKLEAATVAGLADGKVYLGEEAIRLGLADGLGTLASAVVRARTLAGVDHPLPVELYPRSNGLARLLNLFQLRSLVPIEMLPPCITRMSLDLHNIKPLIMAWGSTPRIR